MLTVRRDRFRLLAFLLALVAAGCASASKMDPHLESAIRDHYASHATEERGACRTPKIDTIQASRRIDGAGDGDEAMIVRYSYFDRHADMDADWQRLVYMNQPCGGVAERRFSIVKSAVGYEITAMSGERRDSEPAGGDPLR